MYTLSSWKNLKSKADIFLTLFLYAVSHMVFIVPLTVYLFVQVEYKELRRGREK